MNAHKPGMRPGEAVACGPWPLTSWSPRYSPPISTYFLSGTCLAGPFTAS